MALKISAFLKQPFKIYQHMHFYFFKAHSFPGGKYIYIFTFCMSLDVFEMPF